MKNNKKLTQNYSSWGDKLLQHAEVLAEIQTNSTFSPITIQLALTEACDSDCPFCSVAGRPIKSSMPFDVLEKTLRSFSELGAKSVELTGGGNPLLYRSQGKDINDVISLASSLRFDIGIITNAYDLKKISEESHDMINWIRVSLIQLDEGREASDYNFRGFPIEKLGFSYIIYDDTPNPLARTKRVYKGTNEETFSKISQLLDLYPKIKFVRVAGNCLVKGNNEKIKRDYADIVASLGREDKIFIKDIGEDDGPFEEGCYVGAIRPYIAPHPDGGNYQVYICTSHVLNTRVYDLDYSLGPVDEILNIWAKLAESYQTKGYPYEVNGNKGSCWGDSCKFCYYKFNNKLLHTVSQEMPDKNFP